MDLKLTGLKVKGSMIDIANNPVRDLALLRRHMLQVLDGELSPHGLSHGSYKYLYGLYLADHQSQQSLADLASDDKAAATRALSRLEKQGLITRTNDPNDRRASLVSLTPQGVALRPVIEAALATASQAMTLGLSDQEATTFKALLAKTMRTVQAESDQR